MSLQGFDQGYYLGAKLAGLQALSPTQWAGKTTVDVLTAIIAAGQTAESNYINYGVNEGLAPNAFFNASQYIAAKGQQLLTAYPQYASLAAAEAAFLTALHGSNPYLHYLASGAAEGVNPSVGFDSAAYLTAKLAALQADASTSAAWAGKTTANLLSALTTAGLTPLTHYLQYGVNESLSYTPTPAAGQSFSLTIRDGDTATANVFNSEPVLVPGTGFLTTLSDNDVLTGVGTNPTLNVEIGTQTDFTSEEAMIQPTLNGITTVNVAWTSDDVTELNLADADALLTLNVTRITASNASVSHTDLSATLSAITLNDATRGGDVSFISREEVLTGTADVLAFGVNNARVHSVTLNEGGDNVADLGFYYETINMTSTGSNDMDALTIGANTREDLENDLPAGTTEQRLNITAGAAVGAAGYLEINNLTANGLEKINIIANHRVDIAADKLSALRPQNDGISTNDLEVLDIRGGANVMIDGLDSLKISNNGTPSIADDKVLMVTAGTMTGNLRLGVATAADSQISDGTNVAGNVRGDVDLSVTSGSGNDEIRTYSGLAGTITTNAGNDSVNITDRAAITEAEGALSLAQTALTADQAAYNLTPSFINLQALNQARFNLTATQVNLANAVVGSADMEGVSRIVTGEGNDTVGARDLLAFGDNAGNVLDSGVDNAAQIDTGAGNDTITVRALQSAVNWDDNNPDDANVDDRFAFVAASVTAGAGVDRLNISGNMAENTRVNMGEDSDSVVYTLSGLGQDTLGGGNTVLADDSNDAREYVAVNSATVAVDASTPDLDGAIMDLGTADDTVVFNDSDLPESPNLLVAAAANVAGSGAKLMGGAGTDSMTVNTTDNMKIVSAATALNTAAITGIETITLNIDNAVDAVTTVATGVATTDNDDMLNTAVTLDVMRVDADLRTINLNSKEQRLMTLAGSERFESGDDTTFTLNNMRTGIDMTLTAFEATGVVGASNNVVAIGAKQDDTILSINTATGAITQTTDKTDVTLNINYADARGLTDADSLTINATESFDLALNLDQETAMDRVGDAASPTDDDAQLIENFTLTFTDANAHSVDMMGFGDFGFRDAGERPPVVAEDVSSTAVTSFILNTGAAAGQRIDIDNVNADTIRVNNAAGTAVTAANVTLRVDASNIYNIVTGSGTDIIDMRLDDVRSNDSVALPHVNRADTINAGEGRDTMIVDGDDDLGTNDNAGVSPSMIVNDDVFANLDSIETILVDTDNTAGTHNGANGNLMITIDEQAGTGAGNTNVDTIRMIGNQANRLDLLIGNNFTIAPTANPDSFGGAAATIGGALLIDTHTHIAATELNIESKDDDTDIQFVNMDIQVAAKGGTILNIVNSGSQSAQVEVSVYTADEVDPNVISAGNAGNGDGLVDINTGYAGSAATLAAGAFDKLVVLEGATADDNSGAEGAMTIAIADSWTGTTFTVDASAVLNTDADLTTGGATIGVQTGDTAKLIIHGTQNNDAITGGRDADILNGWAGNDIIVGDEVVSNKELEVVTFATSYDAGDVISVTHNGNTLTATITVAGTTGATVAQAFATGVVPGVTIAGTPFASATATFDAPTRQLRLEGTAPGVDYAVSASVSNAADVATTPHIIRIDADFIDMDADRDAVTPGMQNAFFRVVVNGTTYNVNTQDGGVSLAALGTAMGGTVTYDDPSDVITVTGSADGTALNPVTQANMMEYNAASILSAANIYNTPATGLPTDQANPVVVTETLAHSVLGAVDTINGGLGDDTIAGLIGGDVLNGEGGSDTLDYRLSIGGVTVDLAGNTASGGHATGDVISNFENVWGTAFNDTLTGTGLANTLDGADGNDLLSGGAGTDSLLGGTGADTITGGTGNDSINLGVDTVEDTVVFASGDGVDTITNFVAGTDTVRFTDFTNLDLLPASILHQTNAALAPEMLSGAHTELLVITGAGVTVASPALITTAMVANALDAAFDLLPMADGRVIFAVQADTDNDAVPDSTIVGYYTDNGPDDDVAASDIEIIGLVQGSLITSADFWLPAV